MTIAYDYKTRTSYTEGAAAQKAAHKVLLQHTFEPSLPERGYTNRTLHIDLSTLKVTEKAVTPEMKEVFIGGRGFGLWYLWNAIKPTTKWNDPENDIIISPGPLAGNTAYAGSGKSLVVTLSPLTGIPIDSNVGGYFGPLLKFCGYDALEIQGKAERDVVVLIDGPKKTITIEEAPEENPDSHVAAEVFMHQYADDEKDFVNVSVVSAGKGAEHSRIGCLNFSWFDPKRGAARLKQAGRGGIGLVFRDKKIKALVVHGPKMKGDHNHAADFQRTTKVGPGAGQGDPRLRRPAVQDAEDRHGAPGRGHGRVRPAAGAQLPVRQAQGHRQDPLDRVGEAVHAGHLRRLLVRLPHGVRQGRRLPQGDDRPLQGPHRHGGRAGVRDVRGPRLELRHLRARLDPRVELLLRHLRHRHDLLRHLLRVRDGVLAARHPERRADGRPRPRAGATARRTSRCCTRWRAARASASSSARA